jgi:hypothetical protein
MALSMSASVRRAVAANVGKGGLELLGEGVEH